MSPYNFVFEKACHLPLELEHKSYWAIKHFNFNLKDAGEKRLMQLNELDKFRNQVRRLTSTGPDTTRPTTPDRAKSNRNESTTSRIQNQRKRVKIS